MLPKFSAHAAAAAVPCINTITLVIRETFDAVL